MLHDHARLPSQAGGVIVDRLENHCFMIRTDEFVHEMVQTPQNLVQNLQWWENGAGAAFPKVSSED